MNNNTFKTERNPSTFTDSRNIIVKQIDELLGLPNASELGTVQSRQRYIKKAHASMSKRFHNYSNLEDQTGFYYVNPTSSEAEKMFRLRADLKNNHAGVKINGHQLSEPNKSFVRKLEVQEKMQENERSIESHRSNNNDTLASGLSPISKNMKFDLRNKKHQSTLKTALFGVTQTSVDKSMDNTLTST